MAKWIDSIRSGAWLSVERMRRVALAVLVAGLVGAAFLIATSNGLNDRFNRPLGTDFSSFYAAGTLVLDGQPAQAFDPADHYARERAIFGADTPFYSFFYPPFFLFPSAALALLPYPLALMIWLVATFAGYLLTIRAILVATGGKAFVGHRLWLLLAIAFPAVLVNFGHGQNGFLTAALFGFALAVLPRRPWLAGLLFGLLTYKPQFGLLIPLVLIATGQWRTILGAAATAATVGAATLIAFGAQTWRAFLAVAPLARTALLEQGAVGWPKLQSVFSWVRLWGGGADVAYILQGTVVIAVAVALVWLWRRDVPYAVKAATLLIGTLLATPLCLDYDLMLLGPAIAFICAEGLARGFRPYEKSLLALLWIVPLITRSIAHTTIVPLAAPLMMITFIVLLRRVIDRPAIHRASGALPSSA